MLMCIIREVYLVQKINFKDKRICWDGNLEDRTWITDLANEDSKKRREVKKPLEKIFEIEDEQERDFLLWHPITRFGKS